MAYFYILLIFSAANDFFDLIPDAHIPRFFNIADTGIALIFLGLAYCIITRSDLVRLKNFASLFVILYLLLVLTQVSIASFNYSQSIIDGLIVSRRQFYYLAFPLFLFLLDDIEKIKKMMNIMTGLSIVLIILSVINYSGIILYHHRLAEGQGIRAGITRAYVPAVEIIVISVLWQFSIYLRDSRAIDRSLFLSIFLYAGILFRQTRGHILASFASICLMLLFNKRFKILAGLGIFMLLVIGLMSLTMEQNLILYMFESTYEDLSGEGGEGTWAARVWQFNESLRIFLENFWTGSGGAVIRGTGEGWSGWGDLFHVALNVDLGYWVWLKFYGFPGIVLMLVLVWGFFRRVFGSVVDGEARRIVAFAGYEFTCILISMITLNYFTSNRGIVILCLLFAILVNADQPQIQRHQVSVDDLSGLKPAG